MKLFLQIALFSFFSFCGHAQLIFSDNFESTSNWTVTGTTTPNTWIIGSCISNAGAKSLYITSGGSTNDCTPSGIEHHGYINGSSANTSVVTYTTIQASCYHTLQCEASILIDAETGVDYLELVYSTDMGATWIPVGSAINNLPSFTISSFNLPSALDFSTFLLGFRFTYNNSFVGPIAPAIDNFSVAGTTNDITPPTITCPSVPAVYSDQSCDFSLIDYTSLATTSDACSSVSVSQNPVPGMVVDTTTLITLTAMDLAGNTSTCNFQLQVIDTVRPKVICHGSLFAYADATCSAIIPDMASFALVTEACTPSVWLTTSQSPAQGTVITSNQNVTYTVTDLSGNTASCVNLVVVKDTIAPSISCPTNQTVTTNTGTCTYTMTDMTSLVTATDNCTATLIYNQLPAAGNTMPAGTHAVIIEAMDVEGNSATCTFSLIVSDNIDPVITCPSAPQQMPIVTNCDAILSNVTTLAGVSDNCTASNAISITQSPISGTTFSDSLDVLLTATDASGNSSTCILKVVALDTTAPTVTCLSDTLLTVTGSCSMVVPDLLGTHSAVDNCTPSASLTFSQSPIAGTVISNPTNIIITYIDADGNSGTCETFMVPNESIAPSIVCPTAQSVNIGSTCMATLPDLTGLATVGDNCTGYTISQQPMPNSALLSGTHIVTLTVTDAAGNSTSCTTSYGIFENVAPTIVCPSSISTCNPKVNYTQPVASDNCQFIVTQTDNTGFTSGSIFPIGTTTQTYLVTDSSGNTASCNFTVQVIDYPDTAKVLTDVLYLCDTFATDIHAQAIQSGSGIWTVLTGAAVITNATNTTANVQGLGYGTNEFIWTVSTASCGSVSDTMKVIVNLPPPTALLQDTMYACAANNYLIQGNSPGGGQGTWSSSSSITFNNIHAPITSVLSVPDGFHTLYWTISMNGCPDSKDSSVLYAPPVAKVFTNDTTLCLNDLPFELKGKAAGLGQAMYWIPLEGTATLSNKYSSTTQLEAGASGEVVFLYRLTHKVCNKTEDTLRIELSACGTEYVFDIPTVFTPNKDGDNDFFYIPNLHEMAPDCEIVIVNRWGSKVFESTGYLNPWDGTNKGKDLPLGTYFYEIVSPSNQFKPMKGSISIIR